ncbi:MAG: hypothetical protein ACYSU0_09170 [Planctomycetota bacterium]|jgi:hypothetical protein
MKLVRVVAALAAIVDIFFAFLFVLSPSSVEMGADNVYPRWFGVCLAGSAASLLFVAYDAKPYFRVFLVNACLRALAALIGLAYVLNQFAVVVSVGGAQGVVAVALIAAMVYAVRQERSAAAPSGTQPKTKPKEKSKAKPSDGGKKGKGKKA